MNVQERIERIEALEAEFNKRIKALKAEAQREQEFPQCGDEYWYIDDEGEILYDGWEVLELEEHRLEIGNVFKTKEQAESAVEKLKVEAELRKFSRPFKFQSSNYSIELLTWVNRLSIDAGGRIQHQGTIYFESEEKAQQAIDAVGAERIKKFIFGVED